MNSSTNIWSYGASPFQPVFQGGRLTSNLRYAESRQRQSLLIYSQTIQRAFGGVSNALVDVEKYREAGVRQEQYVRDLDATVRLANLRYNGGITTFLEVLDAQRSRIAQQLVLAQLRGLEFQSVVQLYRALGGGWQQ
jgi:multidrug efflux system outer membrane protein